MISFVIEDRAFSTNLNDNTSSEFTSLKTLVINWLENVLKEGFDPNVLPNSSVTFSNASTMVMVVAHVQINTTKSENRPMLRNLIKAGVETSGFDIVISSIRVNGEGFDFNSVQVLIRITNRDFNPALANRSSPEFTDFSTNFTDVINGIFKNDAGFVEFIIDGFMPGSVIIDGRTVFNDGTTTKAELVQTLVNNTEAFSRVGLSLDQNFLTNTTTSTAMPTTTTTRTTTTTTTTTAATTTSTVNQPAPGKPFPGYAIAIIVICGLALIALPFLIVLFVKTGFCSKVANALKMETPDDLDMKLPIFGGRSYNFH
uniref:uncharacterized protein n=1 Tax=Pristiophorus japonicus TaxID=55135 RepID=UPI00398EF8EA